ncbi:pyrroloquinoline quinone biosynthesis peptide chaperone PqqD [Stenotrophomonas sp. MMGLT7]|uniref:pyrroloquinoline quinone biosynthesis peptide chaperone PqqD n=1 Tax=Stenotrophomonas sp. MMGLT7 TaxID=2901227 RepID=UPI001E4AC1ED|nr:pyrroloquinoline quinone biosynthesis peptide chaperone PqqD [Stenotrophomonas sp. MMGLT7]
MSTPGFTRPALLPGVRLHRDRHRGQWVLLAPERVIELDEVAYAVLSRCDGSRTLERIVDELAGEFDAPAAQIRPDVAELLQQLLDKRLLAP